MEPEITKIIEQYLNGELSSSDKIAFEKRLSENEILRKEVDFHKNIHEAAKRLSLRSEISQAGKKYHFVKNLIISGVVVLTVALGTAIFYVINKNSKEKENVELVAENELIKALDLEKPIEHLETQYFEWNGLDSVFVSKKGVLLSVPNDAFLQNGKVYKGKVILQYQEALDVESIVKSGLSTMSGDKILETQGMFGVQAFSSNKKRLQINPKTGIYVQSPVDELKKGMLLFEGKTNKEGIIDWQNSKKLEKMPNSVDMAKLNFYPPNYEKTLNEMKLRKDKKYRDSLYLSMEEFVEDNSVSLIVNMDTIVSESKKETADKIISGNNGGINDYFQQGNFVFRDTQGNDWNFKVVKNEEFEIVIEIEADINLNKLVYDKKGKIIIKSTVQNDPSKFYYVEKNDNNFNESIKVGVEKYKKTIIVKKKINISLSLNLDLSYAIMPENSRHYVYPLNDIKILVDKYEGSSKSNIKSAESLSIPPSKVLAFWKPQFNNTNLATREFEKRMLLIHKTCNKKVLEVYTKNLDKSLSECDKIVVKMGYPEFEEFSNENLALVNPTNPHLKNLSEYYEKVSSDLRKEFKDLQHIRFQKENEFDENVKYVRNESDNRNAVRSAKNQSEEIELNTESVYKQLGKKRPEYQTLSKSVGFTITSNAAIHNIDRFVREQTAKRETGTFYDKDTKKTAKLSYEKMEIQVENYSTYERIYVYLFPNKLSSFQRISGSLGKFSYSLNQEFVYDIAIVAFKNDGYYFYSKKFIKGENMGSVTLEKVNEEKLDASLQQLNSSFGTKKEEISSEIKWILKEQENYVVQKNRREMIAFRRKILYVVFPCGGGREGADEEIVEPDIEL